MEPEISRRCRACGAAVRSRAGFCPQCGAPVKQDEALSATAPSVEMQETLPSHGDEVMAAPTAADTIASDDALDDALRTGDVGDGAAQASPVGPAPSLTEEPKAAEDEAAMRDESDAATVSAAAAGEPSQPTRRHRVKVAALDAVEGKIAPRVEKLRHASTVMLDEAADDPGLRFVLVAAVLILLSLGVLLLSQILD